MNDYQRIAALREVVRTAPNDPDVVEQYIPGYESPDKASNTEISARLSLKGASCGLGQTMGRSGDLPASGSSAGVHGTG
jgi:carbon monoxide dehydrogenase subunit G